MPEAGARAPIPTQRDWRILREAAKGCQACDLWMRGSQTVFGETAAGPPGPKPLMLVGEQPGNEEDLAGHPFVGPAGRLLNSALEEAGIDRSEAYVTNVVKHFKWEPRGKRRIHAKPNSVEIAACRPWLDAELELVQPRVLVCLGATAAQALLGRNFRVTRERGNFVPSPLAPFVMATVHPAAVLRAPDAEVRQLETRRLIEDLKRAAEVMSAKVRKAGGASERRP